MKKFLIHLIRVPRVSVRSSGLLHGFEASLVKLIPRAAAINVVERKISIRKWTFDLSPLADTALTRKLLELAQP
jgi:hypothetical protein